VDGTQSHSYSFPSGHAAITFAAATVLQQHLGYRAAIPTYAVASYVAMSRLHDNRHYASDVAFGAALGVVVGRSVTFHGRNFYGSPMLVHGGPGRAGGGEELGGVRGVLHHMQRSAIQASPDMLTAITGRWTRGSQRTETPEHPFRHSLATLRVGDTIATESRVISREDIEHFAEFTGDTFYAHTDPDAAAQNPLFGGIVAHGYLVVSLAAGLFVDPAPGPVLANFGVDSLRFLTPVKAGDSIAVTLTVKQITPRSNADYGEVRWDAVVSNGDGDPVATYDVLTLVAKTWP
jgi:oxepin-CoA hydrolase/3-oxo-5,6-dehydrosuberyl-CoA semialdehyde dehydrogenase